LLYIRELLFLCSFARHLLFEKDMQLLHRQSVEIVIGVIATTGDISLFKKSDFKLVVKYIVFLN